MFRGFSAIENLEIATLLSGESVDVNLLKELNIDYVINQGVGELSGGQQQRLSIARVMTKNLELSSQMNRQVIWIKKQQI